MSETTEPDVGSGVIPPLLTPEQFSQGTGGKVPVSDPRVALLLAGATSAIRRYCRWHVAPVAVEALILDGPGGDLLVLPTLRLVSVTAMTVSGQELEPTSIEWSANGEIRYGSHGPGARSFGTRFRSVAVTIEHGFDDTPLPQIVQQVVANAIASPMGATREQAGQVAISWATTAPGVSGGISLLERDMAILDLYRLP